MALKKRQRQRLGMSMQFIADIGHDSAANIRHEIILTEGHQPTKKKNTDDHKRKKAKHGLVFLGKNIVKDMLGDKRNSPTGGAVTQHADDGHDQVGPDIWLNKAQQSDVILHLSFLF